MHQLLLSIIYVRLVLEKNNCKGAAASTKNTHEDDVILDKIFLRNILKV